MKPKKAALCIVLGLFDKTEFGFWVGPRLFDVWGLPRKKALHTFNRKEAETVFLSAEKCYNKTVNFLTK